MSVLSKKAMWQRYIDDALLLTEQVSMASIHGLDGATWACSKNFEVSQDQALKLIAAITGETTAIKKSGIKVGKQSYILMNHDPNKSIIGRKGADSGVCIFKTSKTLLIGVYNGGIQSVNCNSVMEKLSEYLTEHGI